MRDAEQVEAIRGALREVAGSDGRSHSSGRLYPGALTAARLFDIGLRVVGHPDAGDEARNHYDWFMPENPVGHVEGYLDDLETKLTESLTDPFVHDMAHSVLPLIAAYRALRDRP